MTATLRGFFIVYSWVVTRILPISFLQLWRGISLLYTYQCFKPSEIFVTFAKNFLVLFYFFWVTWLVKFHKEEEIEYLLKNWFPIVVWIPANAPLRLLTNMNQRLSNHFYASNHFEVVLSLAQWMKEY